MSTKTDVGDDAAIEPEEFCPSDCRFCRGEDCRGCGKPRCDHDWGERHLDTDICPLCLRLLDAGHPAARSNGGDRIFCSDAHTESFYG